jgi:hypothetical protein
MGAMIAKVNRSRWLLVALASLFIFGLLLLMPIRPPPPPRASWDSISLRDFSLCATNCVYPSPYLSGIIVVNGTDPLLTLRLFINNTDEGAITGPNATTSYATNLLYTSYAFVFKAQPANPSMPIRAGAAYVIRIEATFKGNSIPYTVSITVVAT